MKKFIFICIALIGLAFNGISQQFSFYSATNIGAGSETNGVFTVSSEFKAIINSIPGISNVDYKTSYNGDRKLLEVSFMKNNLFYLVGFEIGKNISAMVGPGNTETHTCTGRCSDDVTSVVTYCSHCKYDRNKAGKIIGFRCEPGPGCCIHSVTTTEIIMQDINALVFII